MKPLLPMLALLLLVVACGRSPENPPVVRDSVATASTRPAPRSYDLDLMRVRDSTIAFDTVALRRLLLANAESDVSVDRLVACNLDDDPFTELLLLTHTWYEPTGNDSIDTDRSFTDHFVVVDSSAAGARIIFDDEVANTVSEGPKIGVFNRRVGAPAFYVRQYSTRGSGAYFEFHRVFRMWRGAVHESDEIVASTYLSICDSVINQSAVSNITQQSGDRFRVRLDYEFNINCSIGLVLDGSCQEQSLVSGSPTIVYTWDSTSARYIPDYAGTGLSPEKMKCLMELGPDDIFRAGFGRDLEALARSGSSRCRRAMARYALDNLP